MGNPISTIVSPEMHMKALQGHPYISQADQCIINVIKKHCNNNQPSWKKILDLGCGQRRLIFTIASQAWCHVACLGIQLDIIAARYEPENGNVGFQLRDFAKDDIQDNDNDKTWNIIMMQRVMHHVHGEDRAKFLQRSFDLLKPDGILIIGDEFIKEYDSEDERILNVAKFYLHIIDEARKGGFNELAKEEAKNLIDDCFSGTKFAGHATEKTFEYIYQYAQTINEMFYSHGSVAGLNFDANNQIRNMFMYIKLTVEDLVGSSIGNFNRGDYKVSLNVFIEELSLYGFVLEEKYEIGPVKQLGGMGVLVFMKR